MFCAYCCLSCGHRMNFQASINTYNDSTQRVLIFGSKQVFLLMFNFTVEIFHCNEILFNARVNQLLSIESTYLNVNFYYINFDYIQYELSVSRRTTRKIQFYQTYNFLRRKILSPLTILSPICLVQWFQTQRISCPALVYIPCLTWMKTGRNWESLKPIVREANGVHESKRRGGRR